MRRTAIAIALALVVHTARGYAAVRLQLEAGGQQPVAHAPIKVDAQRVGKNGFDPTVTIDCPSLGTCTADVGPGTWVFSSGDRRIYAAPRSVVVPATPGADPTLTLVLFPAGEVVGTVTSPASVSAVAIDFRGDDEKALSGRVDCEVAEHRVTCMLPTGTWNVRVGAPGYMPEYRRAFSVSADTENALGSLSFKRGASVSGRIEVERGFRPANLGALRLFLTPNAQVRTAAQRRSVTTVVTPSQSGFFYFAGVEPGEYVVSATLAGAVVESQVINVIADREAQLRQPLLIAKPKTLAARVVPAAAGQDQAWRIRLDRKTPDGRFVPVSEGRAALDGTWRYTNASPGEYLLSVSDDAGNTFAVSDAGTGRGDVDLVVTIERMPLSGEVQMGDKPISGTVTLSSPSQARVVFKSDAEGKFRGELPIEQEITWTAKVESPLLGIEREIPDVKPKLRDDGSAHLTLTLPSGQLGGKVVFEDGRPATRGWVDVAVEGGTGPLAMESPLALDGGFVVNGLPDGKYSLQAHVMTDAQPMLSDMAVLVVANQTSDPITLTVRPDRVAHGVVLSGPAPVVAATVIVSSTDKKWMVVAPRRTDTAGKFSTLLPNGTEDVDVFVRARGFATRFFHAKLPDSELIIRLAQTGGELTISVPPWQNGDRRFPHPWLMHDGAIVPVLRVGEEAWGEKRVVIQAGLVDPGLYSVCLGYFEQLPRMRSGNLRGLQCASTIVPPYGRAELELKADANSVSPTGTK